MLKENRTSYFRISTVWIALATQSWSRGQVSSVFLSSVLDFLLQISLLLLADNSIMQVIMLNRGDIAAFYSPSKFSFSDQDLYWKKKQRFQKYWRLSWKKLLYPATNLNRSWFLFPKPLGKHSLLLQNWSRSKDRSFTSAIIYLPCSGPYFQRSINL